MALVEAPISGWEVDPQFDDNEAEMKSRFTGYDREVPHWRDVDKNAMNDPLVLARAQKAFAKVGVDIFIYFYQAKTPDYDNLLQQGRLNYEELSSKIGDDAAGNVISFSRPDNIVFVMTNNLSDELPMSIRSPWMLAHRLGHALIFGLRRGEYGHHVKAGFLTFVEKITTLGYGSVWPADRQTYFGRVMIEDYWEAYGKIMGHIFGTMNSAKKGTLTQSEEWPIETFVQYLMTGDVTFNTTLPAMIGKGEFAEHLTTDPQKLLKISKEIEYFRRSVRRTYRGMLEEAKGGIWME